MASPVKGKRKSLDDLFTGLEIPTASSTTPPSSPTKRGKMAKVSVTPSQKDGRRCRGVSMTIHADDIYRQYAQDQDPQKLFEKVAHWISAIQLTSSTTSSRK
ncbi:hypothetical protein TOPH_00958 [Tolypocladium ophioglossoides CBS 100239]|uniref:Uncharacterized protein n=1 Tax=Tolypocladium ophioglossoides (strain CBS 100239) TaxID=1163406 RepID=A0A0L0NK34_TOLOC|nr:hypothetical protein TOPH_00958 [Tolypocladium ophioglossoides CBS 100239]